MTDACPSWPTLLAWLGNDVPDEDAERLHEHVDECDECRQRLVLMDAIDEVVKGSVPSIVLIDD